MIIYDPIILCDRHTTPGTQMDCKERRQSSEFKDSFPHASTRAPRHVFQHVSSEKEITFYASTALIFFTLSDEKRQHRRMWESA